MDPRCPEYLKTIKATQTVFKNTYYVPSTVLSVFRLSGLFTPLQPPYDVGSIINSFTDEEFEVKRCLLILIKILKLCGEFESKPRKFTHLNITKLHWGLLWWFSSKEIQSESCSVMPDSLGAHGLYNPWNSPDQNTGVGSLSLLQWIFPTQEWNRGVLHCRRIF